MSQKRDLATEIVTFQLPELIRKLASIAATQEEIADFTGVPLRTLERALSSKADGPVAEAYRAGIEARAASLLRTMWNSARGGNVVMQIWMSKNLMGWRDRAEIDLRATLKQLNELTDEQLEELAERDAAAAPVPEELGGDKPATH